MVSSVGKTSLRLLSRESNSGVPCRTLAELRRPITELPRTLTELRHTLTELRRTLPELRRTLSYAASYLSYTAAPHPCWATPHPSWATPHPCWATPHPSWATPHPNWATPHPNWEKPWRMTTNECTVRMWWNECRVCNIEYKDKQNRVASHATKPLNVKGTGSLIDSAFSVMNVLI